MTRTPDSAHTHANILKARHDACGLVCIGIAGTTLQENEAALLSAGVGSVILFTRNYASAEQLTQLTHSIRHAASKNVLICVDQEGGRVQRFRGAPFPNQPEARILGTQGTAALITATRDTALALRSCGINMNLAPVLDVDSNPKNPVIGNRSFSSDAQVVAQLGAECVHAMQENGVAACGKHFPGHGDTDVDSHLALPKLSHSLTRLEQIEFVPFRAAIQAKIAAIMSAHIVFDAIDPGIPATLSAKVITGLLRNTLGFEGLILTDDFEMKAIADLFDCGSAAVSAVAAGCDVVLVCKEYERQMLVIEALALAIVSGRLSHARVRASHERLERVVSTYK